MNKKTGKWIFLIGILVCLVAGLLFLTMGKADGPEVEKQFEEMTEGKITPEKLVEAKTFLDTNMKRLDEEYASHLLISYEDYTSRFINSEVDDILLQELAGLCDPKTGKVAKKKLSSEELKELYGALQDSCICMSLVDDKLQLTLDYGALQKAYHGYILEPVNALYELKTLEEEEPCIENATLLVSWEELANRAYRVEQIIEKYGGEHLVAEESQWMFKTYINFMLMGANNTPIFDYTTTKFEPEAKAQYEAFMKKNPDCVVEWTLREYFSYLEEMDYTMNYKDSQKSKKFFDTCSWLVTEAEKRVYQQWTIK